MIDAHRSEAPVSSLIASRGVALLADRSAGFLIPMVVYLKTGEVSLSGLALAIEWAPRVISLPITGVLVDALSVRRQLIFVDIVRALLAFSLPVLGFVSVYALMVAGGLLSLCNGYAMLLGETVLARVVEPSAMPSAQSHMQAAVQLSQTTGPVFAGAALPLLGIGMSSVAVGVLFLVGGIWIFVVTARSPTLTRPGGGLSFAGVPASFVAGLRAVFGRPALTRLVLLAMFANLVGGLALASLPALVTDRFGGGVAMAGTVLGAASLASLASAVATTYVVRRVRLSLLTGGAGVCLLGSAFGMAGATHLVTFAAAFALWSASVTIFVIWMRTRRLQLLDGESVGAALGVFVAAILAVTPLSGVILAVFGGRFAPQQIILALAVLSTVGGGVILLWEARASRQPRPEVPL